MAAPIPLRICSANGVFADRSSSSRSGLTMPPWYTIFVHSWCFFVDQCEDIYQTRNVSGDRRRTEPIMEYENGQASRLRPHRTRRDESARRRLRLCHAEQ